MDFSSKTVSFPLEAKLDSGLFIHLFLATLVKHVNNMFPKNTFLLQKLYRHAYYQSHAINLSILVRCNTLTLFSA